MSYFTNLYADFNKEPPKIIQLTKEELENLDRIARELEEEKQAKKLQRQKDLEALKQRLSSRKVNNSPKPFSVNPLQTPANTFNVQSTPKTQTQANTLNVITPLQTPANRLNVQSIPKTQKKAASIFKNKKLLVSAGALTALGIGTGAYLLHKRNKNNQNKRKYEKKKFSFWNSKKSK